MRWAGFRRAWQRTQYGAHSQAAKISCSSRQAFTRFPAKLSSTRARSEKKKNVTRESVYFKRNEERFRYHDAIVRKRITQSTGTKPAPPNSAGALGQRRCYTRLGGWDPARDNEEINRVSFTCAIVLDVAKPLRHTAFARGPPHEFGGGRFVGFVIRSTRRSYNMLINRVYDNFVQTVFFPTSVHDMPYFDRATRGTCGEVPGTAGLKCLSASRSTS